MNTYFYKFLEPDRIDVLMEETNRTPDEPLPEIIDVKFYPDGDVSHTVNTKFITKIDQPQ